MQEPKKSFETEQCETSAASQVGAYHVVLEGRLAQRIEHRFIVNTQTLRNISC